MCVISPVSSGYISKSPLSFGNAKVNVMYFNDVHGNVSNIDSFVTARKEFDKTYKGETNLSLCGGDLFNERLSGNTVLASMAEKYVDASVVGNHDLADTYHLAWLLKKYHIGKRILGTNLDLKQNLRRIRLSPEFARSIIIERNNEKIGIIGASPIDLAKRIRSNNNNSFVSVKSIESTISELKKEVERLESRGVNKIILLAHTGQTDEDTETEKYYKYFAKIGGIDVIVGGHDHKLVDTWEYSSRRKIDNPDEFEPVKIVSTGSDKDTFFSGDLNIFGIMNLMFDDNGVLIPEECENKIHKTSDYEKSDFVSKNLPLRFKAVIATLPEPIVYNARPRMAENVVANLIGDSDYYYASKNYQVQKPDFALINSGTVRGSFLKNKIDLNDIAQVVPFTESLVSAYLTKKQIYEALTVGAKSLKDDRVSPGLFQVSHLRYTVNSDNTVSNVQILDDNGNVRYNLDEMKDDDKFLVVTDAYLIKRKGNLACLNANVVECFNVTRSKAFEYFLNNYAGIFPDYKSKRIILNNCYNN